VSALVDAAAEDELRREVQRLYLVSIWRAFVDLCTQTSSMRPSAGILSRASSLDFTSFQVSRAADATQMFRCFSQPLCTADRLDQWFGSAGILSRASSSTSPPSRC